MAHPADGLGENNVHAVTPLLWSVCGRVVPDPLVPLISRCIVPSDGFYEWRRTGGPKQPYFLHPPERAVLAMAGIWSVWKDPQTDLWVPSVAVITTEANRMMSRIHDRMPVLLPREAWDDWLDPAMDDRDYLQSLLAPPPDDVLGMYPISTRVNNVRNEGPELVEPAPEAGRLGLEG
jgi:putative SOS response-associated peptidase YedK